MSPIIDKINKIIEKDLVLGGLAREAEECYFEGKNMAALACLFVLVEQAVKFGLDKIGGNFSDLIKEARDSKIISQQDFDMLNELREIRNKLFHELHYAWILEDEIAHPFYEDTTKRKIYAQYSDQCFDVVLKMLNL